MVFFVAELRRGGLVVRDQEILGSIPATSKLFSLELAALNLIGVSAL